MDLLPEIYGPYNPYVSRWIENMTCKVHRWPFERETDQRFPKSEFCRKRSKNSKRPYLQFPRVQIPRSEIHVYIDNIYMYIYMSFVQKSFNSQWWKLAFRDAFRSTLGFLPVTFRDSVFSQSSKTWTFWLSTKYENVLLKFSVDVLNEPHMHMYMYM